MSTRDSFVRTSAVWPIEGTWQTSTSFFKTFSWTKYRTNLMCFVLAWRTWFAASITVLRLSHQIIGALEIAILSSESRDCIQVILAARCSKLLYFAFVLDLECCFFEYQANKFEPKYTQYPQVNLLSSRVEVLLASQKSIKSRVDFLFIASQSGVFLSNILVLFLLISNVTAKDFAWTDKVNWHYK